MLMRKDLLLNNQFHQSSQIITKLIHKGTIKLYPSIEMIDTTLGEKTLRHYGMCNLKHSEWDNCGDAIP